jgi:stage II sporulation protein AA (anti-sigma F factor antagonist)
MSNLSEEENIEAVAQEVLTLVVKYECRRLILDLADVEYMTSSMVGQMIRIHRQLHRDEGKLVLCQLRPTVQEILQTSHLVTYFHVADTLDDAAAMFGALQSDRDSLESNADDFDPNDTVDEI